MSLEQYNNLPELFFGKCKNNLQEDHLTFINKHNQNKKETWKWEDTKNKVLALSNFLQSKVNVGDRVMLVSENRPEWLISDLSIMINGSITVPNYTTYTIKDFEYVIKDCEPIGLIVSSKNLFQTILQAAKNINYKFNFIIHFDELNESLDNYKNLFNINLIFNDYQLSELNFLNLQKIQRKDPACIIYTSGTEGNPKGVILSHGGILCNCDGAIDLLKVIRNKKHSFLTWLPLSHSYEHTIQFVQIAMEAKVFYAESLEKLLVNLQDARPTIMTAVPRFYNNLFHKMNIKANKETSFKKNIFFKTVELGKKVFLGQKLSLLEKLINFLCENLVRKKIKKGLGGNIEAFVSGGGPLDPNVGLFLNSLGLQTLQGYGLTETSPVVSCNPPFQVKIETVGKVLKGVEVKIEEDGEILVKGENVMLGYWRKPEATKKVLINDWIHTGDIGEIDEEGYLKITDRKKDIIVNAGGDNISPAKIENLLCLDPMIEQAMVYGDNKNYLVALIYPSQEKKFTRDEIAKAIDKINHQLSAIEKIKNFYLLDEGFTIENNLLTPTMKLKRYLVKQKYMEVLNSFYKTK
jgi:long-chain acyl-CoA synthetase